MEKFTAESLNIEGIKQWSWIEKDYVNCPILLGNGFSLNFSETLKFKTLYENFKSNASKHAKLLFSEFDTSNFEMVLQHIESTVRVLSAIKDDTEKVDNLKTEVREGLIDSINKIHPTPEHIDQSKILLVAEQFKRFSNIYTTNYDLFLYYIILNSNKFGDYFYYKFYSNDRFKLFNQGDRNFKHHIYYLHGALFLYESGIETTKLKKDEGSWLIDNINEQIKNSNYPLFISEGSSDSKVKSIQSNSYLHYCFNKLSESKEKKLVVFGQSLNVQDLHIAKVIDEKFECVAISIRPQNYNSIKDLKAEKNRISSLFKNVQFEFYDSNSLFKF